MLHVTCMFKNLLFISAGSLQIVVGILDTKILLVVVVSMVVVITAVLAVVVVVVAVRTSITVAVVATQVVVVIGFAVDTINNSHIAVTV